MRVFLLLCGLLLSFCVKAQIGVSGKVFYNNEPVLGAAVYLNNTTVGATTNSDGEFFLPL